MPEPAKRSKTDSWARVAAWQRLATPTGNGAAWPLSGQFEKAAIHEL